MDLSAPARGATLRRRDRDADRRLRVRGRDQRPPAARAAAAGRRLRVDSPLIRLLADEIVKDEPGQEAVLDRLLDLLLIAVLRAYFAATEAPGWYRAYADPVVGPALRALHDEPAHPWTVAELARTARRLPRRARPPLQRPRGRAADELPHRLADRARRRPAARARRDRRQRRRPGRLRPSVRALDRVQAPARASARSSVQGDLTISSTPAPTVTSVEVTPSAE